jgi:tellurite resistance protein TerC
MTLFWFLAASAFCAWIYLTMGSDKAYQFASGYLIEKSLSVDNLFVFSVIFTSFAVSATMQRRLLNWGIIGAVILRGSLIWAGSAVVGAFHWILYLFGFLLLWTSLKIIRGGEEDGGGDNRLSNFIQSFGLTRFMTCLLVVEISDVIFALDSIPATFTITQDPFIVFTSNIFAILGLRSLYFVLVGLLERFENLKYGVSAVLAFIGIKILIGGFFEIPTSISLVVTAALLGLSILSSFMKGVPSVKQVD